MGYHSYRLNFRSNDGKIESKILYTHRLVAEYFIPNPNSLPVVNHIDENRLNNVVENLEWVSYKENYKKYRENNWETRVRRKTRYIESDLEGEEWKDVLGYSLYQVSNMGRIRNKRTFKWLRPDDAHTYSRVCLVDDSGKKHNIAVHRLVYCTFANDYCLDGFVIDHIDANPQNNVFSNLQKITQSENTLRQKKISIKIRFND